MNMKTNKVISALIAPMLLMALTMNCSEEDGVITSLEDVSSRITGFTSEITGAGASLTANGTELDKVVRICMGGYCVPQRLFTAATATALTFNVPTGVQLGETEVLFIWPGSERGTTSIAVVALPAITSFTPAAAAAGETVTVLGTNFDIVNGANIGGVAATITSQSATVLKLTVPTGIANNKITLVSSAGNVSSAANLIACTANPTSSDCASGLNLNTGFELGAGNDFDSWEKWNGGTLMTATSEVGEVYRGARAVKITRDGTLGSGQWRIQLAAAAAATDIGASYTVFIWARASVAGGAMRVSTNPNALYTGDQNVPTTWTRLAFTFTANEASTRAVLDMNGNNTVATTFFIDDVKLIKN
jgi:hypothetical protein